MPARLISPRSAIAWRIVIAAGALAAALSGAVVAAAMARPDLAFYLFQDPLIVAGREYASLSDPSLPNAGYCCSAWWGFASNLGVVLWIVAAGATAMAALSAFGRGARRRAAFFALATVLTGLFGLDDLFQVHEQKSLIGPLKGEVLIFPLFGLLLAGYAAFASVRRFPEIVLLGLAVAFLAASVLVDQILAPGGAVLIAEDGTKLAGIAFWTAYHLLVSGEEVLRRS